ncbi:MAG: IPTL-CTERM sorting domain-containing protein [Phycisphaerae bacterium]
MTRERFVCCAMVVCWAAASAAEGQRISAAGAGSGVDREPGMAVDVVPGLTLTANSLVMVPGATANLLVSGDVSNLPLVGVTILVELRPRAGFPHTGTLTFTAAPPVDILQAGDAWPLMGTFTGFDTNPQPAGTGSIMLNGSVDDNGTFLAAPVTYSGLLSGFPLTASPSASGVWDVSLTTSLGTSGWDNLDNLQTTRVDGTITVTSEPCTVDADCDDGLFCNGTETCVLQFCVPGFAPCEPGQVCDEAAGDCAGEPIPTLSQWGLVALALLVMTAGTVVIGRRGRVSAGRTIGGL